MDNWKHRSENMLCKTCMYFVPKKGKIGRCRRSAPTMKGWPALFETDWCGDHKIDENKVLYETLETVEKAQIINGTPQGEK